MSKLHLEARQRRVPARRSRRHIFLREVQAHDFIDFVSDNLKQVVSEARHAGCEVEPVYRKRSSGAPRAISELFIRVNGHLCAVRTVTRIEKRNHRENRYATAGISYAALGKVYATIFHVTSLGEPERYFIVPSAVLLSAFFVSEASRQAGQRNAYLPLDRNPTTEGRPPRVNYWLYEEAWEHLARLH